ncbi:MAG: XRE family transcriptional regulator [Peptococcaceae bacterium BICA1-7]|nr:MAG: XRE family transcriptional regulator [Peptococcaceae bacterium BICA1-7]HBV97348.1 XRE family transcriptional regulator [Desulfotomaculum sp.]
MIKIHLSKLLGERRWTQADLARITGIRPSTIGDYYHELVERVNLNHLDKICEVLGCQVSDVLEYIPKRKRATRGKSIKENRKLC